MNRIKKIKNPIILTGIPSLTIIICLSSILLNECSPVGGIKYSGNGTSFKLPSFFNDILGNNFQIAYNPIIPARQVLPVIVIKPSEIFVKVTVLLSQFNTPIKAVTEPGTKPTANIDIQHILTCHFSFLFSASLRLTSAMISRRHCLLLFFSVSSFHLFPCHIIILFKWQIHIFF